MSSFKLFLGAVDCQMQNADVRMGCEYDPLWQRLQPQPSALWT